MKQLFRFSLLMLALLLPATATAHDFEVDGIYYLKNGTEATVTYKGSSCYSYSDEYSGNLTIPETVTYNGTTYSVTSIGKQAFYGCRELTSVSIANTIIVIGNDAFSGCRGLTSVTIPNAVTSIESNTFYNCSGLTSVTIPNSVTSIGSSAFCGCSGLTSLTIGNSISSIGNSAFSGCISLTDIDVSSGNSIYDSRNNCNAIIETISNTLIIGCRNTFIPNSVTNIGASAFYGCSGLTGSLTIPSSVTSIGSSAFYGCSGLTGSLTIPNSVTSIGSSAFCGCSGLTGSLTIPNSVTSIEWGTFKNCSGLTNINIPKSVETINSNAFVGCNSLQSFYVDEANTNYSSDRGVLISSSTLVMCPARKDNYCIPSTINYLSEYAFNDCMMSELTIEANSNDYLWSTATTFNRAQITSVIINRRTNASFKGMSSLEYVTLGDKAGVYVDIKFAGTGIHEVHLPYAVTICDSCFTDCEELSIIELGDNIISIGAKAFDNTAYLNNQQFESGIKYIDEYAVLYDFLSDTIRVKDGTKLLIEALCYNSPYSIPPLNEVLLPNSLQYIGDYCFSRNNLNSIILPDSLVSIGRGAFQMTKLSSISIPASVMSISQYAFSSINYLTSVRFEDGENILNLGKNEFESGVPKGIFGDSYNIKKAYIGRVLSYDTTYGYGPFTQYGTGTNSQLTEVEIGPYVNHLESRLLYKNPNITSVKVDRNVPPTNPWFESNVYTAATLHIPDGSKSVYQEADGWKNFINIIEDSILATSITLDYEEVTMIPGDTITLTAIIFPENVSSKFVEWSSNDESVATVDENGVVYANAAGQATIIATTKDGSELSASCVVTVVPSTVLATSIELNVTSAELTEGENLQLTATVFPEDATDKTVIWVSSDETVATVNKNGLVTAIAPGEAIITATTNDDSNLSASCLVTVTSPITPIGDNVFQVGDTTVMHGDIFALPVAMTNNETVMAFQTDVFLPEGFSVVMDEDDEYIIMPSGRLTNDHVIMADNANNGAVRVICYTPNSQPISGNEGDLFYIHVQVPDEAEGDYTISLRNTLLTAVGYNEVSVPDVSATVTVKQFIPGDVNDSRTVNVTDIVVAAQYILDRNPSPFILEAADMNGDGNVTVTDVMLIAYLINHPTMNAPKRMPALTDCLDHMSGESVTLSVGEIRTVSIMLDNEMDYSAFQLDLSLPEGLTAGNFRLTDRAGSHAFDVNEIDDGKLRGLCYSPAIEAIDGHSGALLTFDVTATDMVKGDILVDGIELVTTDCQTVRLDGFNIGVNNVTSVNELNNGKTIDHVDYFNLAGQRIAAPESGVTLVVTTYTDGTRTTTKVMK